MAENNNVDIASKYQVELNSRYSNYSKQGSSNGTNSANDIINVKKEQSNNNNKESGD